MSTTEMASLSIEKHRAYNNTRLSGFDLFRGLAAYAVIGLHASMVTGPLNENALKLPGILNFAVPFFLLTSLYFASKQAVPRGQVGSAIKKRAARLLIPYIIWTLIYTVMRICKYYAVHETAHIRSLLRDPVGLFLLGGSGVQMYFLPMLFTGMILLLCLSRQLSHMKLPRLWLGLGFAVAVEAWMIKSGNLYDIATARAFEHLVTVSNPGIASQCLRFVLAICAHAIRCLPLILLAFLLRRTLPANPGKIAKIMTAIAGILLLSLSATDADLPLALFGDDLLSLGAFLLAWSLSFSMSSNSLITRMGIFSFGIYLCHQVFLEVLQVLSRKFHLFSQVEGPLFVLTIAMLVFLLSWLTLMAANHGGPLVKKAFAIE